jgi:ABC-2 type transport system permease protein
MTREIRSEFKKVFTVRSTYVVFGLILVLLVFFSFYVGGWDSQKSDLANRFRLFTIDQQAVNFLAIFPALIGMLLFTHEFRFNTISYSLTLSNSRSKVLLAKVIVVSTIAIATALIVGIASPLLAKWGIHAHNLKLIKQNFSVGSFAWRSLAYGWGFAMAGLVIAGLVRNQIGSIVTLFIVPGTVEGLLSIWLKNNTVYLPFSALHQMLGVGGEGSGSNLSPEHALLIFLGYLIVGGSIAWGTFLKRDAS